MPTFLSYARGAVKMVQGPWGGAPQFRIKAQSIDVPATKAIITQASYMAGGNYQVLHTLNEKIFFYVFGDRVSDLVLSGVAFSNPCDGTGEEGTTAMLKLYERIKLAATGKPITVVLGQFRLQAFPDGISMQIADSELQLGQYGLRFKAIAQTDEE